MGASTPKVISEARLRIREMQGGPDSKSDLSDSDDDNPACVSAVFIHQVIPCEEQLTLFGRKSIEEKENEWRRLNIHFHTTYLGAAINAFSCSLISCRGLSRVGKAT